MDSVQGERLGSFAMGEEESHVAGRFITPPAAAGCRELVGAWTTSSALPIFKLDVTS